jgi:phage shock protein C
MSDRFVIDRHRGLWLGVCRGVADYSGLPVGLVRLALLILTIVSFGIPGVIAYVLIGWLAGER